MSNGLLEWLAASRLRWIVGWRLRRERKQILADTLQHVETRTAMDSRVQPDTELLEKQLKRIRVFEDLLQLKRQPLRNGLLFVAIGIGAVLVVFSQISLSTIPWFGGTHVLAQVRVRSVAFELSRDWDLLDPIAIEPAVILLERFKTIETPSLRDGEIDLGESGRASINRDDDGGDAVLKSIQIPAGSKVWIEAAEGRRITIDVENRNASIVELIHVEFSVSRDLTIDSDDKQQVVPRSSSPLKSAKAAPHTIHALGELRRTPRLTIELPATQRARFRGFEVANLSAGHDDDTADEPSLACSTSSGRVQLPGVRTTGNDGEAGSGWHIRRNDCLTIEGQGGAMRVEWDRGEFDVTYSGRADRVLLGPIGFGAEIGPSVLMHLARVPEIRVLGSILAAALGIGFAWVQVER